MLDAYIIHKLFKGKVIFEILFKMEEISNYNGPKLILTKKDTKQAGENAADK